MLRCTANLRRLRIRRTILIALARHAQHAEMTSLIAWVGVDNRGAASLYFASDSRISWPGAEVWDHGRKLFACRRQPHIFGYCGDVLFPTQTLSQITEIIDSNLMASGPFESVNSHTEKVSSVLESAFKTYPAAAKRKFDVLHCMREGEHMQSRFHVNQITFDMSGSAKIAPLQLPSQSGVMAVLGSGSHSVQARLDDWAASHTGGTSRAVFSAFCDSLRSGDDPLSGGPPQLVGLWRKSPPQTFGVIWQERRYFYGLEAGVPPSQDGVHWFNELFEICDPVTLARKEGAQPQPRPKGA